MSPVFATTSNGVKTASAFYAGKPPRTLTEGPYLNAEKHAPRNHRQASNNNQSQVTEGADDAE